jgi:hypothetical protein
MQGNEVVHEKLAGLRVERGERLVHEEDRGPHGECARDADALAHAAGELLRIGIGELGEARPGKDVGDDGLALALPRRCPSSASARCRRRCARAGGRSPGTRR